jgi:hypothetical protein
MAIAGTNNNLLTVTKITKEALDQLNSNLVLTSKLDWSYSDQFAKATQQIGQSLNIRRPVIAEVREDSMTWGGNLPVESYVPLSVDKIFGVDLKFSDADMTFMIEEFSSRFVKNEVISLANKIDSYVAGKVINGTYNVVGQYSTPVSTDTFLEAAEKLNSLGAPENDRYAVITPRQHRNLANYQMTLFNPGQSISKLYSKNVFGSFAGLDFAWTNSMPSRADGTWTGSTITVNTTAAAAILTSGWADTATLTAAGFTAGATVNEGDVFTINDTYAYNPLTRTTLPFLQTFVVRTAVGSATSAGQALIVSPALIVSGAYKNVDIQSPSATDVVTKYSTSGTTGAEGVVFQKGAFAIACPEIYKPTYTVKAESLKDSETGANIRLIMGFDASGAYTINRLDTFIGVNGIRREFACRVRG